MITGIKEVGDVLKIIQPHKETSVYVGKVVAKEADGSDILLDSSQVFGTTHSYVENRGSTYINSIQSNNRHLYYMDISTGEFIRSSANGQLAISTHYNMASWFETKAQYLRTYNGFTDIIVACDNYYNEVLVSFIAGTTIETVVFSEEEQDNGWMYFATYKNDTAIPENFAYQGDTLLSFIKGAMYRHNVGTNNTFYGKLHSCAIKFIINLPAYASKRFTGIRINSNKNIWNATFTIPTQGEYKAQETRLLPTLLKWINNRLHSDIFGNILTKAGVADIQKLYDGEDLVGELMYVELTNNDNSDVILGEVEVNFKINE
jgi:hypothetical protein